MLVQTLALFSTLSFSFAQGAALRRRQAGGRIVWDGRVAQSAVVADFDAPNGAFDPEFVKGQNVSFSEMILFPNNKSSLLDASVSAKTLEVTINDNSIFAPGGSNPQTAVRRTELMPNPSLNSTAGNSTTTGIKTLHFSLRPSCARPLNTSHEYLLVFLERGDFSANQISFKTGTLLGSDGASKDELVLLGNSAAGSEQLFSTPLVAGEFVNVALKMDFDANTVQVFQSTGLNPLTQQTEPLPNDLSGNGAFHFGVNKNPTDPGEDVLRSGFQEADILEGVEYGGLFIEDNIDGDIILV